MPAEVHIAPGWSAAGCMKAVLPLAPGSLLVHQDELSHGPLPPLESLAGWRHVREEYLRGIRQDWPDGGFSFAGEADLLTSAASLRDAGRIVLWVGTGLAEQLLLAWIPQLLRELQVDPWRLHVVQFVREPEKGFEVHGLGVLNPEQILRHPPAAPVTDEAMAALDAAWHAVTAPDPTALLAFLSSEMASSLPHLRRSLKDYLHRFPDVTTGLSSWELELLRCVRKRGPVVAKVIAYTMTHDMESPDWVGDDYLFARLRRLADASLPHPFLSLSDPVSVRSRAQLTADGEAALAGRASFVEQNGIDDWVGGVHLESSRGNVWFRRGSTLVKAGT